MAALGCHCFLMSRWSLRSWPQSMALWRLRSLRTTDCARGTSTCLGSEEQKQLPAGSGVGRKARGVGSDGPGSASDAAGARIAGDAATRWQLEHFGQKTFITQARSVASRVILAVTSPEKKQRGITAFIVDYGTPGFSASRRIEKMGLHASDTQELTLMMCGCPTASALGEIDCGFIDAADLGPGPGHDWGDGARSGRRGDECGDAYAKESAAVVKSLAEFQAIQNMVAQAVMELDASGCCCTVRRGCTTKTALWATTSVDAELCTRPKRRCAPVIRRCRSTAVGYTREFSSKKAMRDAVEIGEGQRNPRIVILRELPSAPAKLLVPSVY